MTIAVASSPASGSIIHAVSACEITVTGASANTLTGYDSTHFPASPAVVYYLSAEKTGADHLVSPRFSVSSAGTFEWPDVIFPSAGSWTVHLRNNTGDASAANVALTVS
jgi:hypothetical protein